MSFNHCSSIRSRFRIDRAVRAQTILSKLILLEDKIGDLRSVGGLDVSYIESNGLEYGVGTLIIVEYPTLKPYKCFYAVKRICVPYIPGLLAFREMEVLTPLLAYALNSTSVDLLVVDGHGIAHPRGFGIASHVGLVFSKPSIGVAKRLLAGRVERSGGRTLIIHNDRVVGGVLEIGGSKLYISPGHMVSVETSVKLVEAMVRRGSKLPEPTRLADSISRVLKRNMGNVEKEVTGECTKLLLSSHLNTKVI